MVKTIDTKEESLQHSSEVTLLSSYSVLFRTPPPSTISWHLMVQYSKPCSEAHESTQDFLSFFAHRSFSWELHSRRYKTLIIRGIIGLDLVNGFQNKLAHSSIHYTENSDTVYSSHPASGLFALLGVSVYTGVTVNFYGKRYPDWRFSWSYILGWIAVILTISAGTVII